MNKKFKKEFASLNPYDLKYIINRCAGKDILLTNFVDNINIQDKTSAYYIKYLDNNEYGYWNIEWNWKSSNTYSMIPCGLFQHQIKITPFRIDFNSDTNATLTDITNKKQLQEYLFLYINNKCPHYKQAITEETTKFLNFLNYGIEEDKSL